MTIKPIVFRPELKVGSAGPLLISCIYAARTLDETLTVLEKAHAEAISVHGHTTSITVVCAKDALKAPSPQQRQRAIDMAQRFDAHSRGSSTVVLVRGLGGVVVRTFLSAFFMFSKATVPQEVFSSLADAVKWAQGLPGQAPELAQDAGLLAELTRFVDAVPDVTSAAR